MQRRRGNAPNFAPPTYLSGPRARRVCAPFLVIGGLFLGSFLGGQIALQYTSSLARSETLEAGAAAADVGPHHLLSLFRRAPQLPPPPPPPSPPPPVRLPPAIEQYDDSTLFQLALTVDDSVSGGSEDYKGKIGFLFITRGPLPLAPLWARFLEGHEEYYSIFIHTARKFQYKEGELPRAFENRQILSQDVKWGGTSMIDAEKRLLANALLDPAITRFALLSDSCIPIWNFTYTYHYLMRTPHSFIRGSNYKGYAGTGRWNKNFLPLIPVSKWRKGSQWMVINRQAAKVVVADTKFYALFRANCLYKHDCYPDEHYAQTMLYMLQQETGLLLANRSVTWVDWSLGGTSPMSFRGRDISKRVVDKVRARPHCTEPYSEVKTYCYLFARKFKPDAARPLLNLSSYLYNV